MLNYTFKTEDGGSYEPVPRPRRRAYACTCEEAREAVDTVLERFGEPADRRLWMWYCRRIGVDRFLDLGWEVASCYTQGEIKWPAKAFHARLKEAYPRGNSLELRAWS